MRQVVGNYNRLWKIRTILDGSMMHMLNTVDPLMSGLIGEVGGLADVHFLYVPRKQGGRGLMQLEEAYVVEITKLMAYVGSIQDPLI
jgi:hypothetical protein